MTRESARLHGLEFQEDELDGQRICVMHKESNHQFKNMCESCSAVSKISSELRICLRTVVFEYEKELSHLRMQINQLRKGSESFRDCKPIESEYLVYSKIPLAGFKDELRKLGDSILTSSKDTAMLYYEAAAINGCSESCVRVAMNYLRSDQAGSSVEYGKTKVKFLEFSKPPATYPRIGMCVLRSISWKGQLYRITPRQHTS